MSLNPSNQISARITGRRPFQNVAGMGSDNPHGVDVILAAELKASGIPSERIPECVRETSGGEPQSIVVGALHGWSFRRAWYYWIAGGPGIPVEDATAMHTKHGTSVRVCGDCSCPSPLEYLHGFAVGSYHVDSAEGLAALAVVIRTVFDRGTAAAARAAETDESERWPCQQLLGGTGSAMYMNDGGFCKHPECKPAAEAAGDD